MRRLNILFITNMCTHYVRPLFEILAKQHEVGFYFTGGHEAYWHKQNVLKSGDFQGTYLSGIFLCGKIKITPRLFALPWKKCDVVIKTIDDRFALPMVFCAAKVICTVPLQMEAIDTYMLMKRAADPVGVDDKELTKAVRGWCSTVDRIALIKHRWLFAANLLFLASSFLTLVLLLALVFV